MHSVRSIFVIIALGSTLLGSNAQVVTSCNPLEGKSGHHALECAAVLMYRFRGLRKRERARLKLLQYRLYFC